MIVNQGESAITTRLLILGGTTEASALAQAVHKSGLDAVFSYAGRVRKPREQPLPTRVGGFGGVDGLLAYIAAHKITHLIDATHPFAAQMSWNAAQASAQSGVALAGLTRPAWRPQAGDNWCRAPDIEAAVAALDCPPMRIMLALGRMHLQEFAVQPQHHYILRLVDPPDTVPMPDYSLIVDRGPFTISSDKALIKNHKVDMIVSKNAGGTGARAKIDAARELGLPLLMIDCPKTPSIPRFASPAEILRWVSHPA